MADQPQPVRTPPVNLPTSAPQIQRPPQPPARPAMPAPTGVAPMPRPSAPPPMAPRPVVAPPPAPRPPAPPVAAPTVPTPPAAAPGEPYTSEMRTMSADIGRISTGQQVVGTKPTPPKPAVVPMTSSTPAAPAPIAIPASSGGSGMGRKILYILIGLAGIGGIFLLVSMMFGGGSTPIVSPTPTASPSATLGTSVKSLSSYFRQIGASVELKADGTAKNDFLNAVTGAQPTTEQSTRIAITGPFAISLADFLGAILGGAIPTDLKASLGTDWAVLAYGQTEQFDGTGQKISNPTTKTRLILVSELTDISKANQTVQQWQMSTLANDMHELFAYDPSKKSAPTFSTGSYRQIAIYYQNFPYADMSLDWAIATASNGKSYLVISSSRQAMFFAIDQLMQ